MNRVLIGVSLKFIRIGSIHTIIPCLLCLCIASVTQAQEISKIDSSYSFYIEAAKEIMTHAGSCALISLDDEGIPRVRTMDPFLPDDSMHVWFGSNPHSRKIKQIRKDPRVSLYYLDHEMDGYVMIHGQAELIEDLESKKSHWKDRWKDFYPDYPNDYILIKVEPVWIELISVKKGILGDKKTWKPVKVMFN